MGVIGARGRALTLLGRTKEAEALYDHARMLSVSPDIHMAAAYSDPHAVYPPQRPGRP